MKRSLVAGGGKTRPAVLTIAAFVAAAMAVPAAVAAQTSTCGTARLLDVEAVTELIAQGTTTSVHEKRKKSGEREVRVYTTPAERQNKRYLVTVRLDDLLYTGESSGNMFWDFDPTRLVINDPVDACVYKDRLILKRPDGKEYKTKVVRTVRDAQPASAEASRP